MRETVHTAADGGSSRGSPVVSMAAVPSQASPHKLSFSSPCVSEPEERWSKCDKYADLEKVVSACVCVREKERLGNRGGERGRGESDREHPGQPEMETGRNHGRDAPADRAQGPWHKAPKQLCQPGGEAPSGLESPVPWMPVTAGRQDTAARMFTTGSCRTRCS